jgi:hypothetical protein
MPFPDDWTSNEDGVGPRPPGKRWKPRDNGEPGGSLETTYNGVTYRSRSEARWAYLFDILRVKFEYEPGKFNTPHGWYLPDFLLPTQGCWVEVKGPHPTEVEKDKAASLARQTRIPSYIFSCGIPLIEATGQPRYDCGTPPSHHSWKFSPNGDERIGYMFGVKECCGRLGIVFNGRTDQMACDCRPDEFNQQYLVTLQRAFQISKRSSMW